MKEGIEQISSTSKTALITLYAHSLESQDENPVLVDQAAVKMTDALRPILAKSDSRLLRNLSRGKMSRALQVHIALRAKKYDEVAEEFIENNPDGIVVNLGCGFDSRYQRLKKKPFLFIDLDLPEMINIKKGVFAEKKSYRLIGQSIFNREWMAQVKSYKSPVLFIAEGLFMYLHPEELNPWLKEVAESFPNSYLLFETVAKKYTRGFNKKMVEFKLRREIGVEGDVSYHFGLSESRDLERLSEHFQWIEDWSYFDDKNPKIHWMNWIGKIKYLKYVQWTAFYRIQ